MAKKMYVCMDAFHYARPDGSEAFVPKGARVDGDAEAYKGREAMFAGVSDEGQASEIRVTRARVETAQEEHLGTVPDHNEDDEQDDQADAPPATPARGRPGSRG